MARGYKRRGCVLLGFCGWVQQAKKGGGCFAQKRNEGKGVCAQRGRRVGVCWVVESLRRRGMGGIPDNDSGCGYSELGGGDCDCSGGYNELSGYDFDGGNRDRQRDV
ncbi:unnamed protein product [Ilex paraguariensis]|uniref:Uncharacterized protein n=1 Tax=Ilex paraguariensis TaxID=185542 RepID=A0ABC8RBN8_9AQUA